MKELVLAVLVTLSIAVLGILYCEISKLKDEQAKTLQTIQNFRVELKGGALCQ